MEAGVARHLDHAALGGNVPFKDDEPARRAQWSLDRGYHVLALILFRTFDLLGEGSTGHGELGAVYEPRVEQALAEEKGSARPVEVHGGVTACGLEVGDDGRALADPVEVVYIERDARLSGYSEQVQDKVGRAAAGRPAGDGVLERLAGEDALRQVHDKPARRGGDLILARVERRRAR